MTRTDGQGLTDGRMRKDGCTLSTVPRALTPRGVKVAHILARPANESLWGLRDVSPPLQATI